MRPLLALLYCLMPLTAVTPSFPGAEGFGAETPGGRGGKVIFVTNRNDAGPGSFRAACEAEGPRIVVLRTGGLIDLKKDIKVVNPYLTIAAQTAPGDGICLRDIRSSSIRTTSSYAICAAVRETFPARRSMPFRSPAPAETRRGPLFGHVVGG